MRKILFFVMVISVAGGLSSCNTVEGVGRDVESAGRSIQNM